MTTANDRGQLTTERSNPDSAGLDALSSLEMLDVMQSADRSVFAAVEAARVSIANAIDIVADKFSQGGRLIYIGAGTSGRLGMLDAVECPPTFHTHPSQVQAILAGGENAFIHAVEGAEDGTENIRDELAKRDVGPRDVVMGITAGGTTPFVHAGIEAAKTRGAATIFFACVSAEEVADRADLSIRVVTGPEVLAGSTRLKAGTATKLVLNSITTLAMARVGRVHGNQMVDLRVTNVKLRDRAERLVMELAEVDRERATELLSLAKDRIKVAIVMEKRSVDASSAREILTANDDVLRRALS
ncbi:MAG: N-acetylmuramic acid 6-phosphate etherase [Planctomycetota bacterium]|jgi:N-acetylmuramic acid 6-phosphate etherase